jgi:hypothetical protein
LEKSYYGRAQLIEDRFVAVRLDLEKQDPVLAQLDSDRELMLVDESIPVHSGSD